MRDPALRGDVRVPNHGTEMLGTVKSFNSEKGFGFIRIEDGQEVFVHHTAIEGDEKSLTKGQQVEFEMEQGPKGATARDVKRLS